jgi:hypothetical protein
VHHPSHLERRDDSANMDDPQSYSHAEGSESEFGCSLSNFTSILTEIDNQPSWRARADKEMDYYDGNQLDSETLRRQAELGIPPAIEPLIGPTIDAVLGMEVKTRTDWRVTANNDDDPVAEAMNFKLNQAERQAGADTACSEAYRTQIGVGLGWVEVSKNPNPFEYEYRCNAIHRNEIWWDFLSTKADLSDARYLVRRRWTDLKQAQLMFPDNKDLLKHAVSRWIGFDYNLSLDGGQSTGLAMSWNDERGWTIEEQNWRDVANNRVCLYELWYREWERVNVLKLKDGRVVEYDESNPGHVAAVATRMAKMQNAVVPRVRLSWWAGPHKLWDGPSPYKHTHFPYVPFWGKREDRTNVPYGLIRGMMYLQDEVNARTSKMQWMLSAVRVERTDGAVKGTDEQFRQEVARPDADIILDHDHMAKPGATFKVHRDAQLEDQQYQRLVDAREGIKRTGAVYNAFQGQDGQAKSGLAINSLIEQSTQSLADINDNFKRGRAQVGDILLSLIIEDSTGIEEEVVIPGDALKEEKRITINSPTVDEYTGIQYLNNDIERTKLNVVLSDVPSTPTFRAQQLAALSEVTKAMPTHLQVVVLPHLLTLMDIPEKQDIITAIKQATEMPTEEQIQQRIDEAVAAALAKAMIDIKSREVDIKARVAEADIDLKIASAVSEGVKAAFSAMQAGQVIATIPQVAPIADELMASAGFQDKNGEDPNFPQPPAGTTPPAVVHENTSPASPPVPSSSLTGIETPRVTDNEGAAHEFQA